MYRAAFHTREQTAHILEGKRQSEVSVLSISRYVSYMCRQYNKGYELYIFPRLVRDNRMVVLIVEYFPHFGQYSRPRQR